MGRWIETIVLLGCLQVMSAVQDFDNPLDFYARVGEDVIEALADSGEQMNRDGNSVTSSGASATAQSEESPTNRQSQDWQEDWSIWRQRAEGQEI